MRRNYRSQTEIKGRWFGQRFVLEKPYRVASDATMRAHKPEIGDAYPAPPGCLATFRYQVRGWRNVCIRSVGSDEPLGLSIEGTVEVLLDNERHLEYVVADEHVVGAHGQFDIDLIAWKEGV